VTASKRIVVGARTSPLSIAQTEEVLGPLRSLRPDVDFVVVPVTTGGDRQRNAPLLSLDRGMFVKEIETALFSKTIDLAVHSAKDLPAVLPDGLIVGAFGERKDARDVLVNRWDLPLSELPTGARLGTSSPRRKAQIQAARPDLEILPIRGNVGTRLDKVHGGEYDGVVLAAAGLIRLGRQDEISEYLSPETCIPEVGQGALALEIREGDREVNEIVALIGHRPTGTAVIAERAFLKAMGGGCQVPVTAHAQLFSDELRITAMAALPDGSRVFSTRASEDSGDPESAGRRVAETLLEAGATRIVARGEG
jgi:hydroxymethylbilane synthase